MSTTRIVYLAVLALAVIFIIMIFSFLSSDTPDLIGLPEASQARINVDDHTLGSAIAINGINFAGILLFGGAILALLFSVLNLISKPKALAKLGLTVLALAVIVGIGYATASNEVTEIYMNKGITTPASSKMIGGWLNSVFIMGAVAVVGAVASEVVAIFK